MSSNKRRARSNEMRSPASTRRWLTVVVAAALSLGLAACGSAKEDGASSAKQETGPIKIGMPIAKTGVIVPYDGETSQGFRMAVADINAKGGVNGRKIELIEADTRSDIAQGRRQGQKVINEGAEILVVSCEFDFGSPAAAVAQANNMIALTLCAASPKFGVQGIGPLAYSANIAANAEGGLLAEWAAENAGKKAFILTDDTIEYDKDLCDGAKQRFGPSGGQVVGEDSFKNGDQSIASQIRKIRSSGADVVFLCSYPPGGASAIRQIRAAGIDAAIVSGVGMDGSFWSKSVPNMSDVYVSTPASVFGDDPNEKVNEFMKRFEKETGKPPSSSLSIIGYTDAEILARAIEKAGSTDGPKLAEVMNGFTDEQFSLMKVAWTPDRHIQTNLSMAIVKWSNGKASHETTASLEGEVDLGISG
jgi:branched-chain amino acid transport system substrate-binding protein